MTPCDDDGRILPALYDPPPYGVYRLPEINGYPTVGTECLGVGNLGRAGEHLVITRAPDHLCADPAIQKPVELPNPRVSVLPRTKRRHKFPPGKNECHVPSRNAGYAVGFVVMIACVLRQCSDNVVNALSGRHGAVSPACTGDFEPAFLDMSTSFDEIRAEMNSPECYYDFERWLAKWPAGKQKSIIESLLKDEVIEYENAAMIKTEINAKMVTRARLIQYYTNLATQAAFGPVACTIQKAVTKVWYMRELSPGITVTFGSGLNATGIAGWMKECIRRGATHYHERDGTNWDSTQGPEAAAFRQRVYDALDPAYAEHTRECNFTYGTAVCKDGMVRYRMEFTVKSGHNDTTLGNGIVNIAIALSAMKQMGLRGHIIATGDDLLIAVVGDYDLKRMVEIEASYGILPEANKFTSPVSVSFVSGIFIHDGDEDNLAFVPTPGRILQRLWWTTKQPPRIDKIDGYRRGVARGLLAACQDVPIIREWLMKFDSNGKESFSDKGYNYRGCTQRLGPGVYEQFALRYGLTVREIHDCEAFIRDVPAGNYLIRHPVLERIVEVDGTGIDDREPTYC